MDNVMIVLDASGAFTASKIFNATGEYDRAVEPPAEGSEES